MTGTPLAEQIQGLLPFLDHYTPPSPDVQPAIQRLLSFLRNESVCDFLLGDTNFTPLPILTSDQHLRSATVFQVTRAFFKPPIFSLCQTDLSQSSYIPIPVFSVHPYIVGIIAGQIVSNRFKDLECKERDLSARPVDIVTQSRFALDRNDDTIIFFISDFHGFTIEIHSIKSTRLIRKAMLSFNRSELEAAYHQNGRRFNETVLTRCVRIYGEVNLLRSCPLCNAEPHESCQCQTRSLTHYQSKNQFLTTSPMKTTLSYSFGAHQGIRHEHYFANGTFLDTNSFGDVVSARPVQNGDMIRSILKRSIREHLQELTYDPWKNVLPSAEEKPSSRTIIGKDAEQIERIRRKQARIERNRECARRSNLKKKIERHAQVQELQALRNLQETLMEEEQRLREENIALRRLVQSGIGQAANATHKDASKST